MLSLQDVEDKVCMYIEFLLIIIILFMFSLFSPV